MLNFDKKIMDHYRDKRAMTELIRNDPF